MFEYSLSHWSSFLTAIVLLTIAPGPDLAFIIAKAAKHGRKQGFNAMYGVWSGAFVHVIFAAVGLSAILTSSTTAFTVVKYIGAAYLIWIGISSYILRKSGAVASTQPLQKTISQPQNEARSLYRQGVLIALLNPKTALFFLAFLPLFVVEGAGPIGAQLFLHGCLVILAAMILEPIILLISLKLFSGIKNTAKIGNLFDKAVGVFFVGLGIKLAIEPL